MKEKGIIVMDDIPVTCDVCILASLTKNHKYLYCNAKAQIIYNAKPNWCPIKSVPERAYHEDYCDNGRYDKGWNDCLNELLGMGK